MALSYFTESEAPRDFRISSTESESNYTKCPLCYTIKKNFYCTECIRAGNFIHSSMPYSDRYAEKQAKLIRLKANRKHVLERCERLLHKKSKHASLELELKQCKDKVNLIKLAIEQRKNNIEEKKKVLEDLRNSNTELSLKLPRYQKRVASMAKHVQEQHVELEKQETVHHESIEALAALRRARIRQLGKYIFPVYITYDSSESIEDMEFVQVDEGPEPSRERLHIIAAWIPLDLDLTHMNTWVSGATDSSVSESGATRVEAALQLAAQLAALLAHTLGLPHAHEPLSAGAGAGAARLCTSALWAAARLAAHAGAPPSPARPRRALAKLHHLIIAANTDQPLLGRIDVGIPAGVAGALCAWRARLPPPPPPSADAEPEHITWPQHEMESAEPPLSSSPPAAAAASLVTSLASMWRGWTK